MTDKTGENDINNIKKFLNVIVIEDSEIDAKLIIRELERFFLIQKWELIDNKRLLEDALTRQSWDIVLSDYSLPQFSGMEAFKIVRSLRKDLPFILISGNIGEEIAVDAIRAGVNDYLIKDRLSRLGHAVERELREAEERKKLKDAEDNLVKSEAFYRSIFENSLYGIAIAGRDGNFSQVNSAFCELLEYSKDEIIGKFNMEDITHPDHIEASNVLISKLLHREIENFSIEKQYVTKSGKIKDVISFVSAIYDEDGKYLSSSVSVLDITERKKAYEALQLAEFSIEHSGFETIWFDRHGNIVRVNEAACRSLGYTREEFLTMSVKNMDTDCKSDEDWGVIWNEVKIRRHYVLFERYHRRKNGSVFPVEVVSSYFEYSGREFIFSFAKDISERKAADEALHKSEEQFRALTENSFDTIMRFDSELKHVYVNPMVEKYSGIPRSAFIGKTHHELGFPEDLVQLWDLALRRVFDTGELQRVEFHLPLGYWIDWLCIPEFDSNGEVRAVVTSARDITERKKAEEERVELQTQLLHAQKMEAVGRLAGGVAHDFNNMLSVISGYGELAKEALSQNDPLMLYVSEILKAARRSTDLTRQLLAFSRRQVVEPRVLDINKLIKDSEKMLQRLVGEDINVQFIPTENIQPIRMDPSQVDQILANLTINARDAMPNGGMVTIELNNVSFDKAYCESHITFQQGDYVMLSISDTGSGMSKELMEHVFEPFFTTKAEGKGTGLGLSTVYGIVKQNNGFINLYSEPGIGTTFKIYFPQYAGELVEITQKEEMDLQGGTETVLIVEDEKQILSLCSVFLNSYGYKVLTANHPGEAILLCEKHNEDIHLLVTDVVMPNMNGKELHERIIKLKPHIKVLYMSGYTEDVIFHRGIVANGISFIQKPFSMNEFIKKVKEVLGQDTAVC